MSAEPLRINVLRRTESVHIATVNTTWANSAFTLQTNSGQILLSLHG